MLATEVVPKRLRGLESGSEMMRGKDKRKRESLTLMALSLAYEAAFWEMLAEFEAAGEPTFSAPLLDLAHRDFAAYIQLLEDRAEGVGLPPGYAPQTTYWLVRNETELLGQGNLRHTLTPALRDVGGHIGYRIRPAVRGRGYGTQLLALLLRQAEAYGLTQVLLTCDSLNIGSKLVIQSNGGVLMSEGPLGAGGPSVARYWIDL